MGKTKRLSKATVANDAAENLVAAIITGIQEKKGHSIVVMNIGSTGSAIADYFVICDGNSGTQVAAIAESVEEEVRKLTGETPSYREGYTNAEWILLDYINVVVHIFQKEQREFYGIERFWADAETRRVE
jgi:ribosome-associated protein